MSSVKDRLGIKIKRHSSPDERKSEEKNQPKTSKVKSIEENGNKKPNIDNSLELEDPMDMEELHVILNKCLSKFPSQSFLSRSFEYFDFICQNKY